MNRVLIIPLTDDTSTHNNTPSTQPIVPCLLVKTPVRLFTHLDRILDTTLARHSIGASTVNYYTADALPAPSLQRIPAHSHRRGLKLVLCENGGGAAWRFGRDHAQIVEAGVGSLDADMGARGHKALGVCTARGDILRLCRGY